MSYHITETCTGCTACTRICPVQAITGERKERHEIIADVCIDCGACSRVCPVNAIKDNHHMSTQRVKRSLWPKPVVNAERCISCGVCIQTCPTGCLGVDGLYKNGNRAVPVLTAPSDCIACALCETACPVNAIEMVVKEKKATR